MYEAFYGLNEKPFNLTPDPRFLFLSDKHKEAFAHLLYGIKNRCGFIMVTGEIGTGKTTICRTLLNQLDETTEVAFIFNPCLSPEELLRSINEDFGIASQADSVKGLIDELNDYLLSRNAKGKNCVLVIDEAQDLQPGVLEQIRLLSNLETETQKLLQIVLIGQPELAQTLSLPELRQLNQRITARYHLRPLDEDETLQYIAYRLRVAGGRRKVQFTRGAVRAIFRASGGTPRVINALCDRALLIGYTQETRDITARIVKRASAEIRGERIVAIKKSTWKRYVPSPAMLAAVIIILLAGNYIVMPLAKRPVLLLPPDAATPATAPAPANDPGKVSADVERVGAPEQPPLPPEDPKNAPLIKLIDSLDPVISRNAASIALLRAWDTPLVGSYPESDAVESLVAFVQKNHLDADSVAINLDHLAAVNLPAFVKMAGDRQILWVALVGVADDSVRITGNMGEESTVPKQAFNARYLKQAVIPWRDPAPSIKVLQKAMTGDEVRILQAQLRGAGLFQNTPSGTYDDMTESAVKTLQLQTGLEADGKAGRLTRMVLSSWLPGFASPELTPNTSETPTEEAAQQNPPGPQTPEQAGASAPAPPSAEGPAPGVPPAPPTTPPTSTPPPSAPAPEPAPAPTPAPATPQASATAPAPPVGPMAPDKEASADAPPAPAEQPATAPPTETPANASLATEQPAAAASPAAPTAPTAPAPAPEAAPQAKGEDVGSGKAVTDSAVAGSPLLPHAPAAQGGKTP